jgi:membrane-associated protease RseP (regulator of RpoE activity)
MRVLAIVAATAFVLSMAVEMVALNFSGAPGGSDGPTIARVVPGRAGADAGLMKNDEIVSIDGKPVKVSELGERVERSHGRALTFEIMRAGATLRVPVLPTRVGGRYRVGIELEPSSAGTEPPWTTRLVRTLGAPLVQARAIVRNVSALFTQEKHAHAATAVGHIGGDAKLPGHSRLAFLSYYATFAGLALVALLLAIALARIVKLTARRTKGRP